MQQCEVRCESKTHDNVFLIIVTTVQYVALEASVVETFYKLSSPHEQIRAYVEDVVRTTVPRINLDDVFEQKDHIAKAIAESVSTTMEEYGYRIEKALVTDIIPDERVKESMNAINAAKRLRIAAADEAEAEKIKVVKAAEAEAEKSFLQGKGVSKQRKEIMRGLKESVADFERDVPGTSSSEVMNMIMLSQYFDMLKEVGTQGHSNTVFIPHVPGAVPAAMTDLAQALSQSQMEASAAGVGVGETIVAPRSTLH